MSVSITKKEIEIAIQKILPRSHVDENGCWIWDGGKIRGGYGTIWIRYKSHLVHRIVYSHFNGDPGDMFVCHTCDVPSCVNPEHLWAGTNKDNQRDMREKGRDTPMKGELNGMSKLNDDDIMEIRRRYSPRVQGHSGPSLAEEFGVSHVQIYNIVKKHSWGHIK